jgi:hypothetical protein
MLQSITKWQDGVALLKCLEGLDKIKAGKGVQPDVLNYISSLCDDLSRGSHLISFAASSLCDSIHRFHTQRGKHLESVHCVYLQLKNDVKNLLCLAYLGESFGDWEEAKQLCLHLHRTLCAHPNDALQLASA